MKNFVQAWSDKTQVRLGLHRNIVIIGVLGERKRIFTKHGHGTGFSGYIR